MRTINSDAGGKEGEKNGIDAKKGKWYHGRVFILVMLFFVIGIFALPLLWLSPRFNLFAKTALTVVVVILTGLMIQLLYIEIKMIAELMKQLM
ncbi:hypothetical protein ACFLQ8_03030 [Candidatus Auribacterota bacterium]